MNAPPQDYTVVLPLIYKPPEPSLDIGICIPAIHEVLEPPKDATGFKMMGEALQTLAPQGQIDARIYVEWRFIQPNEVDIFFWHFYDACLRPFVDLGINLLITVARHPAWASSTPGEPIYPSKYEAYAYFLTKLVRHYNQSPWNVHCWEIDNEVDNIYPGNWSNGQGCYGNHVTEYVTELSIANQAIKAVDPTAKVVMGGLAMGFYVEDGGPFRRNFFTEFLDKGGTPITDAFNFHLYPPTPVAQKVAYIRGEMQRRWYERPIWITEIGEIGDPADPVSLERQRQYVTSAVEQCQQEGVEKMFWYSLSAPMEPNLDLLTRQWQPKPAFWKLAEIIGSRG